MSRVRRHRGLRSARDGFTIVELLIYLVVALVVLTAGYKLLVGQNRLYIKQRELQDVRGTLKAGGNLLAFELRQAAPHDLYAIEPHAFEIRSFTGGGTICGMHPGQARFGLWGLSGYILADAESALAYATNSLNLGDEEWLALGVTQVWENGGGVPFCVWNGGTTVASEMVVAVDDSEISLTGVTPGAPLRVFQRARYAVHQEEGRWWLGRRLGAENNPYEILTGPLQGADALQLTYYDESGVETTDPTLVRYVDIRLVAESQGKVPRPNDVPGFQEDTVTVRTKLRG